jgi:hypothetical protein
MSVDCRPRQAAIKSEEKRETPKDAKSAKVGRTPLRHKGTKEAGKGRRNR